MLKKILGAEILALGAQAGIIFGKCPSVNSVIKDFDIASWTGRWYEITRDKYTPLEYFVSCVATDYEFMPDGTNLRVHSTNYKPWLGWSDIKG